MTVSQPLVATEAEEAEKAGAAADWGREDVQLDMGLAQSEAAVRLAEEEVEAVESVQAAVVVGQEEEDTTVRRGAPSLDAGAAEAASVDQSKGFRRRGLPARILVARQGNTFTVSSCQEYQDQLKKLYLMRLPELAMMGAQCRRAVVPGSQQLALGRAL